MLNNNVTEIFPILAGFFVCLSLFILMRPFEDTWVGGEKTNIVTLNLLVLLPAIIGSVGFQYMAISFDFKAGYFAGIFSLFLTVVLHDFIRVREYSRNGKDRTLTTNDLCVHLFIAMMTGYTVGLLT